MDEKKLARPKENRMVGGVCSGLGNYFNVDATVVRILFALSFFFLYPGTFLIYLLLLIIMPEER
jgi:phage shock protein PspC (stress-responsive transcriptional regulator)